MSTIALLSGAQDPSQLNNVVNSLIGQINGYVTGATPTISPVVTGTTSANLPNFGVVILGSTVAGATYVLSRPVVGQSVQLVSQSTKSQTVTILAAGTFNKSHTKLTFKTTTGTTALQQAISLVGETTSIYAITGAAGSVKST